MLAALPISAIVFPGTDIRANLAERAKTLGIPAGFDIDEDKVIKGEGVPRRPKRHRHATCPWAATQWTA